MAKEEKHLGEIVLDELDKETQLLDDDHAKHGPAVMTAFQDDFKKSRGKDVSTEDKVNLLASYMSKYEKAMYKEGEIEEIEPNERHLRKYRGVIENLARNMGVSIDKFVELAMKNDKNALNMLDNWKQRYVVDDLKNGAKADLLLKYRDDKIKISDYMAKLVGEKKDVFLHRYEETGLDDALDKYRNPDSDK